MPMKYFENTMQPVSIEQFKNLDPLTALSSQSAHELTRFCHTRQVSRNINPFSIKELDECDTLRNIFDAYRGQVAEAKALMD